MIAGLLTLAGCAGRGIPETLDPGAAERAVRETAPAGPIRAVFRWQILDGEARFSGQGVARIEAPYRARLDLFGPRDEAYLSAVLAGSELRLPGPPEPALPPPAMIWSVLGVVRPPDGATLLGTREADGEVELHYAVDGSRIVYRLVAWRLRGVEWRGDGRRMVLALDGAVNALPAGAAYRDWSRNTELQIELERVENVEPYPPDIWTPGR